MKIINAYDFDKTVYDGDSTLDFYFYCLKRNPQQICYIPVQIFGALCYLLGIYSKVKFKEVFFVFLHSLKDIDSLVDGFWESHEHKIKEWYKQKKHRSDVVISASPEFLLQPICRKLEIEILIASKVDKSTGKFDGENCYGENKVHRLNNEVKECIIKEFYSDSLSDTPLAQLAQQSYFVAGSDIIKWTDYKPKGIAKAKLVFASKEFLTFIIIGCVNAVNGVLFAYIYSLFFNVNTAFIIGYLTSLTISYLLNSYITFKEKLELKKYIKFCLSYIPNFLIQNAIVIVFYNYFGWYKLLVFVLAAAIGVPITFLLIKLYAFRKDRAVSSA